jgi:hypothetical protein
LTFQKSSGLSTRTFRRRKNPSISSPSIISSIRDISFSGSYSARSLQKTSINSQTGKHGGAMSPTKIRHFIVQNTVFTSFTFPFMADMLVIMSNRGRIFQTETNPEWTPIDRVENRKNLNLLFVFLIFAMKFAMFELKEWGKRYEACFLDAYWDIALGSDFRCALLCPNFHGFFSRRTYDCRFPI